SAGLSEPRQPDRTATRNTQADRRGGTRTPSDPGPWRKVLWRWTRPPPMDRTKSPQKPTEPVSVSSVWSVVVLAAAAEKTTDHTDHTDAVARLPAIPEIPAVPVSSGASKPR